MLARVDAIGAAMAVSGLVLFNFAWNQVSIDRYNALSVTYPLTPDLQAYVVGWAAPYNGVTLGLGVLLLALFVWWEGRAEYPLVPTKYFDTESTLTLVVIVAGFMSFGKHSNIETAISIAFTSVLLIIDDVANLFNHDNRNLGFLLLFVFPAAPRLYTFGGHSSVHADSDFRHHRRVGHWLCATPYRSEFCAFVCYASVCRSNVAVGDCTRRSDVLGLDFRIDDNRTLGNCKPSVINSCFKHTDTSQDAAFPACTIILANRFPQEHQGAAASIVNTLVNYSISLGLGSPTTMNFWSLITN